VKTNTLAAVSAISSVFSMPQDLEVTDFISIVLTHLGTGSYYPVIIMDNKVVAIGEPHGLYAKAFTALKEMVQKMYTNLVKTMPKGAQIISASEVRPVDFSYVKMNRISPKTARKKLTLNTEEQMVKEGVKELFWLNTEEESIKFLVCERNNNFEVQLTLCRSAFQLSTREMVTVPVTIGYSKKLKSAADAENEARYWFGCNRMTVVMVSKGIITKDEWCSAVSDQLELLH